MSAKVSRTVQRLKRHGRVRRKVIGTEARPRLQIFRSLHHTYAFVIDDSKGHTLVTASTREGAVADGLASHTNIDAASKIGQTIARARQSQRHQHRRVRHVGLEVSRPRRCARRRRT